MPCSHCEHDNFYPHPYPHSHSPYPPQVLEIRGGTEVVQFLRVLAPVDADDSVTPPQNGLYRNTILVYPATSNVYLYTSDGIPTKLTPEAITDFDLLSNRPKYAGEQMTSSTNIPDVDATANTLREEFKEADSTLATAIEAEATLREEGDKTLNTAIEEEATTRQTADATLQDNIATLTSTISSLDEKVDTKQDALTAGYGIDLSDNVISVTIDEKSYVIVNGLPDSPAEGNTNKIHFTPNATATDEYDAYLWSTELNEWLALNTYHESTLESTLSNYALTTYVDDKVATCTATATEIGAELTSEINELREEISGIEGNDGWTLLNTASGTSVSELTVTSGQEDTSSGSEYTEYKLEVTITSANTFTPEVGSDYSDYNLMLRQITPADVSVSASAASITPLASAITVEEGDIPGAYSYFASDGSSGAKRELWTTAFDNKTVFAGDITSGTISVSASRIYLDTTELVARWATNSEGSWYGNSLWNHGQWSGRRMYLSDDVSGYSLSVTDAGQTAGVTFTARMALWGRKAS